MNQDLISRQAVNDMLKELTKKASGRATLFNSAYAYYRGAISDVYYGVKGLPSAQPEHTETHSCDYKRTGTHDWIPVTERLPEGCGEYLVTKRSIGWNCEEYNSVDIAYYGEDSRFHKANKIFAWMPLPEPYAERRQDETN